MSMHINLFFYQLYLFFSFFFFLFLFYAASISSLFYDHAADEATVGVHPGGNAKQGTLSLILQPYIMGFLLTFATLLIALAQNFLHVSFNFLHFLSPYMCSGNGPGYNGRRSKKDEEFV